MATTQGIDVSFWQDNNGTPQKINWSKAHQAGAVFAFIKASESNFTDEDFGYNWIGAKQAGLLRGAYHFYNYTQPPEAQADYFINLLKNDWGELPPALDLEERSQWAWPGAAAVKTGVQTFLQRVEAACGRKPLFYTNPNMILYMIPPIPEWLKAYPLWIANYTSGSPLIAPWSTWTFWQYSQTGDGYAYGMESPNLDLDYFNGTEEELRKFANVVATPPLELTLEQKVALLWDAHPELHPKPQVFIPIVAQPSDPIVNFSMEISAPEPPPPAVPKRRRKKATQ
jgi:lysozyme